MKTLIHNGWQEVLEAEFHKEYYLKLHQFLKEEYKNHVVYPEMHHIFEAFELTPFSQVKVVILGQDPYHEPNQAHGLSFSVLPGVSIPPSLRNIYRELEDDLGIAPVNHGYLKQWAEQGVLLLNSVLTVRKGMAYSHRNHGWEKLTDTAIKYLSDRKTPVIFILWGNAARSKKSLIDESKNVIIESAHPSPLSARRGFFGSHPFSKTNIALEAMGERKIDWQLAKEVNQ